MEGESEISDSLLLQVQSCVSQVAQVLQGLSLWLFLFPFSKASSPFEVALHSLAISNGTLVFLIHMVQREWIDLRGRQLRGRRREWS